MDPLLLQEQVNLLAAAQAPALPAARAQILGHVNRHTNFEQLYNDEAIDPYCRDYARIMARFDAALPNATPSQTLFQQVMGRRMPQAYLCCATRRDGEMRIYCVHCPNKFLGALDGTTTPCDDHGFGFFGEVVHGHNSVLFFPDNAFETVTTWAKTSDYILQHLNDLQNDPAFPPDLPDPDDPNISEVTTRHFMFLPHVYVPLVLSARGHTVKQLWEILYPAILQCNELIPCAPLIQWMRATASGTSLANPLQIGPPPTAIPLQIPPADETLLLHCTPTASVQQQLSTWLSFCHLMPPAPLHQNPCWVSH
jgi:hypothetical protein